MCRKWSERAIYDSISPFGPNPEVCAQTIGTCINSWCGRRVGTKKFFHPTHCPLRINTTKQKMSTAAELKKMMEDMAAKLVEMERKEAEEREERRRAEEEEARRKAEEEKRLAEEAEKLRKEEEE